MVIGAELGEGIGAELGGRTGAELGEGTGAELVGDKGVTRGGYSSLLQQLGGLEE